MKILEDVGLDGLDVDWEYPKNPQEAQHYVALLGELRAALDARSHAVQSRHWLSIAAPCGEQMRILDVRGMDRYLDLWNLMLSISRGFLRTLQQPNKGKAATECNASSSCRVFRACCWFVSHSRQQPAS